MRRWSADALVRPFSARENDPGDAQEPAPQSADGDSESYPELAGQSAEPDPEAFPRRVPNFGHALLFVCFAGLMLLITQIILFALGESPVAAQGGVITIPHPKLQLAALAASYLTTLLAAWLFYPVLWQRGFLDGIRWHWEAARRQAPKLIALGLLLGAIVQAATYFIAAPKSSPIDDFFLTQSNAWLITIFGTIVAPVFEEVCFRGFLVPAFAIAYDWLSLPRTAEGLVRWRTTATLTPAALIFSAILSSIFFAWLHAEQVGHARGILVVLFCVSLVLTFVRVKTDSVAASAMVHGAYNFFVFLIVMIQTGGYRHFDRLLK